MVPEGRANIDSGEGVPAVGLLRGTSPFEFRQLRIDERERRLELGTMPRMLGGFEIEFHPAAREQKALAFGVPFETGRGVSGQNGACPAVGLTLLDLRLDVFAVESACHNLILPRCEPETVDAADGVEELVQFGGLGHVAIR